MVPRSSLKRGSTVSVTKKQYIQSDLGYPATSGPEHIRISDLAGYESLWEICLNISKLSRVKYIL